MHKTQKMITIGKDNILTVARQTLNGMYLEDETGNEVLLPNAYIIEGLRIGDKIEVFVYNDSEDRIIATTLDPKIQLHQFAFLKVKQLTNFGAFMDWGLNKDLLVPFSNQAERMLEGKSYIVYLDQDSKTNRLVGTTRFNKVFTNGLCTLKEGDEVEILIYSFSDMGANAIINNQFKGLIYKNEIFRELNVGDHLTAYIKTIREDFKIDLRLQKDGYSHIEPDSQRILDLLKSSGGFVGLNDKSDPQEIIDKLQMSKKTFKKSVGLLYKKQLIILENNGIKLLEK